MFEGAKRRPDDWRAHPVVGGFAGPRSSTMDVEALALLCPDWREPMIALDIDTRAICYANHGALKLFKRRFPLIVNHGRLELESEAADAHLTGAMHTALYRDLTKSTIVIDDQERKLTYCVRICVPQGFMRDVLRRRVCNGDRVVVLEVTSSQQALSRSDLTALGEAFGLTHAETSILALLGQGRSLAEIASTRGVEIETVRSQCKLLFGKTRSRRQSDLVKLVVALCTEEAGASY